MDVIEAEYGKPLRDNLIDLYDEHRSMAVVAEQLGVSRGTIWGWRLRIGLSDADLQADIRERDRAKPRAG